MNIDPGKRELWVAPNLADYQSSPGSEGVPIEPSRRRAQPGEEPDLIGAYCDDGYYRPVLDIDFPVQIKESETPGHFHLAIDVKMTWEEYEKLLRVLYEVGIIEGGYMRASIERKDTFVATKP